MKYGPIHTVGWCLEPEDLEHDVFSYIDPDAPIRAGDEVAIFLQKRSRVDMGFKRVQQTNDGRWWFTWFADPEHTQRLAIPVDHTYLSETGHRLIGVAAVVDRRKYPRSSPRTPWVDDSTPDFVAWFAEISRPALEDWATHGVPAPADTLHFNNSPDCFTRMRACST